MSLPISETAATLLLALPVEHLLIRLEAADRERLATLAALRRETDRLRRSAEPELEHVAGQAAGELAELVDSAQECLDKTSALIAARHVLLRRVA